MSSQIHVLIVDDEAYVRESLGEMLRCEGLATSEAAGVQEAERLFADDSIDVVVTDLKMPSGGGQALLAAARSRGDEVPIVVMSGVGTIDDAVAAMKAGAFDFLQKPVDPEQLRLLIRRAAAHRNLLHEVSRLRGTVERMRPARSLVGGSPGMRRVRELIAQVAPTDATVLIQGESGTGKELASDEIHRLSPRAMRTILRINCAALPAELIESELFGHKKGAFTGALEARKGTFGEAEGGTLVLDEISSLGLAGQAKLLRVLESGEYQVVGDSRTRKADVRVLALSNEDLAERVQQGSFRSDLYYRLNVFPIAIPPLRAHKEDIGEVAAALMVQIRPPGAGGAQELSQEALAVLSSYDWPGNVRELRNLLERAAILSGDRAIDADTLRTLLESPLTMSPTADAGSSEDCNLRKNLDAHEKELVLRALEISGGVKREAARRLGVDPRNLGYYLRKHGI